MIRAKVTIIVILLVTGVSCSNLESSNSKKPLPINSGNTIAVDCEEEQVESTSSQASQLSAVEIGIDGTPSMEGYVKASNSRYSRTLDRLDSVTSNLSPSKRLLYKFGLLPGAKKELRSLVEAKEANFYRGLYQGNNNYKNANIDKAIPSPDPSKVSILVTDLYQQRTEIGLIRDKLRNYLIKDYAVGILAVRSEFDGRICDYNSQGSCFDYPPQNAKKEEYFQKEEFFHPFYVLFLGKYGYIEKIFKELNSLDSQLFAKEQFIIFSPQLVSQKTSLVANANAPKRANGVTRQATMWVDSKRGKLMLDVDRQKIALLGVSGRKQISLPEQQASYNYLPYALPIKTASEGLTEPFQVKPTVGFFERAKNDFNFERSEASTASQHITLSEWQLDRASKNMSFAMQLDPKQLPSGTYFVGLNLFPVLNRNNFAVDNYPWWQGWHTEGVKPEGNKTHNLKYFLDDMQGAMLEVMRVNKTTIGQLCYVIQKQN